MDVLDGERYAQDLLQANELFSIISITPNPNKSFESGSNQTNYRLMSCFPLYLSPLTLTSLLRVVLTKQISRTK